MKIPLTALILAAAAFAAPSAHAVDSIRCDGKIVETKMSILEVVALCGEPDSAYRAEVPARARNRNGFTFQTGFSVTERLVYERGYGRFPVEMVFIDGELRRIVYLYGLR